MEIAKTPWNCLCFKMSRLAAALKDPWITPSPPDTSLELKIERNFFIHFFLTAHAHSVPGLSVKQSTSCMHALQFPSLRGCSAPIAQAELGDRGSRLPNLGFLGQAGGRATVVGQCGPRRHVPPSPHRPRPLARGLVGNAGPPGDS